MHMYQQCSFLQPGTVAEIGGLVVSLCRPELSEKALYNHNGPDPRMAKDRKTREAKQRSEREKALS